MRAAPHSVVVSLTAEPIDGRLDSSSLRMEIRYEVEEIVAHRGKGASLEYKVKWAKWREATWARPELTQRHPPRPALSPVLAPASLSVSVCLFLSVSVHSFVLRWPLCVCVRVCSVRVW